MIISQCRLSPVYYSIWNNGWGWPLRHITGFECGWYFHFLAGYLRNHQGNNIDSFTLTLRIRFAIKIKSLSHNFGLRIYSRNHQLFRSMNWAYLICNLGRNRGLFISQICNEYLYYPLLQHDSDMFGDSTWFAPNAITPIFCIGCWTLIVLPTHGTFQLGPGLRGQILITHPLKQDCPRCWKRSRLAVPAVTGTGHHGQTNFKKNKKMIPIVEVLYFQLLWVASKPLAFEAFHSQYLMSRGWIRLDRNNRVAGQVLWPAEPFGWALPVPELWPLNWLTLPVKWQT